MRYMGIVRLLLSMSLFIQSQIIGVLAQTYNGTREYCYTGSDLYQNTIQNCVAQDTSFNGTWYCAKMVICEQYMASGRECIQTKGCAKDTECQFNPNYNSVSNNGGMIVSSYCCKNKETFPDDDTLAVEVGQICNSASSRHSKSIISLASMTIVSAFAIRFMFN